MVSIFFGESSTDDEWKHHQALGAELFDCAARTKKPVVWIIIVDREHHRPNERQRKLIAENRKRSRDDVTVYVATVTESILMRNVLSVLNWLAPPKPNQHLGTFPTFDHAMLWAEKQRGELLPVLRTLLAEARQRT